MYSLSSQLHICCGCQQPIITHHIPTKAGSLLASRGITVLACGHRWHSLCIELIYQENYKTLEKEKKFFCSVYNCNRKTNLSVIQENLPSNHRLINNSTSFAQIYFQPYFNSLFAMEVYLSHNTDEQLRDNQQNTPDIQLQAQELENNAYLRSLISAVYNPDQSFFLLLNMMVDERKHSPLHLALSQGYEEEALKIANAMNITQLKSHYQEIEALLTPEYTVSLFDIVESLDESSRGFLLDYWLLINKIEANPQNEAVKRLLQAMRNLLP